MKHIGILAHSAEGATLCYRTVWLEGMRAAGPAQPSRDHPDRHRHAPRARRLGPRRPRRAARRSSSPTPPSSPPPAPISSSCPTTAPISRSNRRASRSRSPACTSPRSSPTRRWRDGRRRIAILGTNWTMTGPVYPGAFGRRGLDWESPGRSRPRGSSTTSSWTSSASASSGTNPAPPMSAIIEKLAARGCDAVALVCTEIPLLITAAGFAAADPRFDPPARQGRGRRGARRSRCRHGAAVRSMSVIRLLTSGEARPSLALEGDQCRSRSRASASSSWPASRRRRSRR